MLPGMDTRPPIYQQTQVPNVPSLEPLRRTPRSGGIREGWTPLRKYAFIALIPLAFWAFTSLSGGITAPNPVALLLTAIVAVGSAFVLSSYLNKGALSGGSCALGPLVGVFLAGWLVDVKQSVLGLVMAAVVVAIGSVQRVTRASC